MIKCTYAGDPLVCQDCLEKGVRHGPCSPNTGPNSVRDTTSASHTLLRDKVEEAYAMVGGEKASQYGMPGDPHAASAAAETFGFPAWMGQLIRIQEKLCRPRFVMEKLRKGQSPTQTELAKLDEDLGDIIGIGLIARMNLHKDL